MPVSTPSVPIERIHLARGDITRMAADAIVNAANSALTGGGGVDGAIHRAGGPAIMAELRRRYPGGTPTGTAVATVAGDLPARWVIHAVGPVWHGGSASEEKQLRSTYTACVRLAAELGARSMTFPAIGCGIYGYPLPEGARVALEAVRDALADAPALERATFVLYGPEAHAAFDAALGRLAGRSR